MFCNVSVSLCLASGRSAPLLPFLRQTWQICGSWWGGLRAGTKHRLTQALQTLGFFLQSGPAPGQPPNHMVKKTTSLSEDWNAVQTKRGVLEWIWVGGWVTVRVWVKEVIKNLACTVNNRRAKPWCSPAAVQGLICVSRSRVVPDNEKRMQLFSYLRRMVDWPSQHVVPGNNHYFVLEKWVWLWQVRGFHASASVCSGDTGCCLS